MKKTFCLVSKTKAEYGSGSSGGTVPAVNFSTLSGAKAQMRTNISAGTATYFEIYGPSGVVFRGRNPGGA